MTSFKTSDGGQGSAYAVVAAKPTKKYLFVVHEWWGLNDYIKQEADRLQKELGNVNVLALDLYDGQVASKREDAAKLMGGVKEERVRTIIEGALEHAGEDARVATIGWCFGGGWSLQSSILAGFRAAACVMYYGMPEKEVEKLKHLNAPVLGIFATKDAWITPQVVKEFEAAMKKAGKKLTVRSYNADHAFANPSNPNFDKEATGKAHAEAIAFLKKHLK
jgi:carboxymethylenebutenolidase